MIQSKVNRTFKDRLFRLVFQDKKNLLELYNAIAHRQYDNPEDLEITTLEDAIYMGMKNDVSFMISDVLNLYEHQSSFNPNMPVRGLGYFSEMYQEYIDENRLNIYGSKQLHLPVPQYIVFYNGIEEEPDRIELRLSDSFSYEELGVQPCLECKAIMLNINYGHNMELMKRCRQLQEYALFVNRVRENGRRGIPFKDAVDQAVDRCIKEGILADILAKNRAEVCGLILYEYDAQKQMAIEREEGISEGEAKGEAKIVSIIRKKMGKGYNTTRISEELELDEAYVLNVCRLIAENGDSDDLQIAATLLNPRE